MWNAHNYDSLMDLYKVHQGAAEDAWYCDDDESQYHYGRTADRAWRVLEAIRLHQERQERVNRADALIINQENFLLGYSHRR